MHICKFTHVCKSVHVKKTLGAHSKILNFKSRELAKNAEEAAGCSKCSRPRSAHDSFCRRGSRMIESMQFPKCARPRSAHDSFWRRGSRMIESMQFPCYVFKITFEPRHDKTNKMSVRPQRRLRSAWASAQSDQSLRCALIE